MLIEWSEEKQPNKECPYNHAKANTPFGEFLITWKGWKEFDCPTIDETPWGDYGGYGNNVEEAKQICEEKYRNFLIQELEKLGDTLDEERKARVRS